MRRAAPAAVAAAVRGKGHELKTTPALLASDEVHLEKAVVTADSLHCQDLTAHLITREKGGDYLFQVRANQPTWHPHAQEQLAAARPLFPPSTPGAAASKNGP